SSTILLDQLHHFNSRKRVVTSVYMEDRNIDPSVFNYATHFVYDISGNVKRLYQENKRLPNGTNVGLMKVLDYNFDLISGKVNEVWYQTGKQDQYLYLYQYDANNRLVNAQSGRDIATLRYDARYRYQLHGPLARTELGHDIVQGVDYAYTLQGWLKGINGLFLNENNPTNNYDLGSDGVAGTDHALIPADVYGYTLGYYANDYTPIDDRGGNHPISRSQFGFRSSVSMAGYTGSELFNGNIAYTTYANRALDDRDLNTQPLLPFTYSYQYDQLNRIVEMRNHNYFAPGDTWNYTTMRDYFAESVSYDANGNIQTYSRNGWGPSCSMAYAQKLCMDQLTYRYKDETNNNKLDFVHDEIDASYYRGDIDNQNEGNYNYDNIGNLISDNSGDDPITDIQWTVYGIV
ncbi:MAG TPA: hypothetical protein VKH37_10975, partial [Ferruginibacter sp.]|nr:hypothetical protein [Ferruginibacter sp.]